MLDASLRPFDSVIERVAEQMDERIRDFFGDGFVEFGVFAADDQFYLFAEATGEVAHHARKAAKDRFHGNHAGAKARRLQFVGDEAEAPGGLQEGGLEIFRGSLALGESAAEMLQAVTLEHQLADQVNEFVEFGDVHADGARHLDGARRAPRGNFAGGRRSDGYGQRLVFLADYPGGRWFGGQIRGRRRWNSGSSGWLFGILGDCGAQVVQEMVN